MVGRWIRVSESLSLSSVVWPSLGLSTIIDALAQQKDYDNAMRSCFVYLVGWLDEGMARLPGRRKPTGSGLKSKFQQGCKKC